MNNNRSIIQLSDVQIAELEARLAYIERLEERIKQYGSSLLESQQCEKWLIDAIEHARHQGIADIDMGFVDTLSRQRDITLQIQREIINTTRLRDYLQEIITLWLAEEHGFHALNEHWTYNAQMRQLERSL